MAFSPDGRLLATTSIEGTVRLWDPATGNFLRTLADDTCGIWMGLVDHGGAWGAAFSPDGRLLATASGDAAVQVWN